jgi:lipid-A-disaccharide synthase
MLEQIQVVSGQSHTVLAACDVTLIASGTATLEAALYKRPMVIAYRMGWLSWELMRRKQLQPWVGLPNILSHAFIVPELIQDRATPKAMADAVLQWVDDMDHQPAKITALQQQFLVLHNSLRRDTSTLASHAIEKVLAR